MTKPGLNGSGRALEEAIDDMEDASCTSPAEELSTIEVELPPKSFNSN